jgi:Tfp pilus assembly protein PilF
LRGLMRMKKLQILLPIALLFVMLAAGSSAAQEKNTSKKNNSDTYMISAEQAYLKNNFKEAMANCVSALEQNPENDVTMTKYLA